MARRLVFGAVKSTKGGINLKQGKTPTRAQKEMLTKKRKDWKDWLFLKETQDAYIFQHKFSGKEYPISKTI